MSSPRLPSTEAQPARKVVVPKTKRNPSTAQSSVPDLDASLQSPNIAKPHSTTGTKCPIHPPINDDEIDADADLAAACSFEAEVKLRRDYFYGELLHLLFKIHTLLRRPPLENATQKSEPLRRPRPWSLAAAWEKNAWCTTYQTAFDLDPYVDTMTKDIADLQIWIKHWDDCGEGETMFREHFHRQFGEQIAELVDDEEISIPSSDEPLSFAAVVAEEGQDTPSMMMSGLEIDTQFVSEPVVFGAAPKKE